MAMTIVFVEPKGAQPGSMFPAFHWIESPLHLPGFFKTLYQRYEDRFVYGPPLLAERGSTTRFVWHRQSPVFQRPLPETWPELDFEPRMANDIA